MEKRELGIYVHIPFCVRKCAYCDFLSFPAGENTQQDYFEALNEEIASFVPAQDYEAVSVYFGGGTPSLPESGQIIRTLDTIRRCFHVRKDAEITIECNPGTLDPERLVCYQKAGFNRLSIGLQSAGNHLLRTLGRIHTFETFQREYLAARSAGFDNISIDLMYGLPGQTLSDWEDTLGRVMDLRPEHISA
ncbi:MAG: radical SAM protein, partial [Lachnospiraceae bacterium]|nr:radical SAM protein [Lachnospiraceae bacterium]